MSKLTECPRGGESTSNEDCSLIPAFKQGEYLQYLYILDNDISWLRRIQKGTRPGAIIIAGKSQLDITLSSEHNDAPLTKRSCIVHVVSKHESGPAMLTDSRGSTCCRRKQALLSILPAGGNHQGRHSVYVGMPRSSCSIFEAKGLFYAQGSAQ